jgi:hypothetical protein
MTGEVLFQMHQLRTSLFAEDACKWLLTSVTPHVSLQAVHALEDLLTVIALENFPLLQSISCLSNADIAGCASLNSFNGFRFAVSVCMISLMSFQFTLLDKLLSTHFARICHTAVHLWQQRLHDKLPEFLRVIVQLFMRLQVRRLCKLFPTVRARIWLCTSVTQ